MRRGLCVAVPMVALASVTATTTEVPAWAGTTATSAATSEAPRVSVPTPTPSRRPEAATAFNPCQNWAARNWSGYCIIGGGYTSVSGTWTVPTVNTPVKKAQRRRYQYSGTWVGIDGVTNSDLIQAGTEQDYLRGQTFYQAWWEILPAAETPIASVSVHPGDSITVSITQGSPTWTITLTNNTTHQSFTTHQPYSGPRTSVEWVQEAPTVNRRIATLADDSTFAFDDATVNGSSAGLISSEAGVMYKGGKFLSTPSAPNPEQDGFAVAYGSVAPPAPSS